MTAEQVMQGEAWAAATAGLAHARVTLDRDVPMRSTVVRVRLTTDTGRLKVGSVSVLDRDVADRVTSVEAEAVALMHRLVEASASGDRLLARQHGDDNV